MGYHDNQKCIDACLQCAAICNHCASSCLSEQDVEMMTKCVQMDMECAALCYATAQLLSLGSIHAKAISNICAEACRACAEVCGNHNNEHCQECAAACRKCADECERVQ